MNETNPNWTTKPARIQLQRTQLKPSIPIQTGLTFNIWYNKWSQGTSFSNNKTQRYVSPFQLDPIRDSGYTIGDKNGTKVYCLYFARGCCVLGPECEYLHHLPCQDTDVETEYKGSSSSGSSSRAYDCFGREKFAEYRDDMGGVGSFQRENRSLYVGGLSGALPESLLSARAGGAGDNNGGNDDSNGKIESRLRFLFGKFGELDRIRYVASKNCAFVQYRRVSDAEFAREATMNQTLLLPSDPEWAGLELSDRTSRTGLLVKWANEDPDPGAKRRKLLESKRQTRELIKRLLLADEKGSKENTTGEPTEVSSSSSSSSRLLSLWLHRHGIQKERHFEQRTTPEQFLQQYLAKEKHKSRMQVSFDTNINDYSWRQALNEYYNSDDDDSSIDDSNNDSNT